MERLRRWLPDIIIIGGDLFLLAAVIIIAHLTGATT